MAKGPDPLVMQQAPLDGEKKLDSMGPALLQ